MVLINVIHRGECIPILYALLTNKSEKIYTKLLKLIFENENSNIQIEPPKFNPMIEYFETYYIGDLKPGTKTVRLKPTFEIKKWNMHDMIFQEQIMH